MSLWSKIYGGHAAKQDTVYQAVSLLEQSVWSSDLEAIKPHLVSLLTLLADKGPLEDSAVDLAEALLSEYHNDITVDLHA
jgi:hypothetical protein